MVESMAWHKFCTLLLSLSFVICCSLNHTVGSQNFQFIIFKYYPPPQLNMIVQNMTQIVYKRRCFFPNTFLLSYIVDQLFRNSKGLQGGVILSSTYLPKGTLSVFYYINEDGPYEMCRSHNMWWPRSFHHKWGLTIV
jgi:hypothetical protein